MAKSKSKINEYKDRFDSPVGISNVVMPKPKVKKSVKKVKK